MEATLLVEVIEDITDLSLVKMFLGYAVTVLSSTISTVFVLRTSILKSKARFRGLQPRLEISCRFEVTSAK